VTPIIVLIGPRASGKSTLARLLAAELGYRAVDLDEHTCQRLGAKSVREAWDRSGEKAFRVAESAALVDALRLRRVVLALGGGTPTAARTRRSLESAKAGALATIVYLRADPATLRARMLALGAEGYPPLRVGNDPIAEVEAVVREREAVYRALADLTLETANSAPAQAVERLLSLLRGQPETAGGNAE
jgi:shikimate kinase